MSATIRRMIPLYMTFIIAVVLILRSFVIDPTVAFLGTTFLNWSSIIRAVTMGLGFLSILFFHGPKLMSRSDDPVKYQWFYSGTALFGMFLMAILGVGLGVRSSGYLWYYDIFYRPVAGLSTAVSGFFALTAMYRAFRIRSLESAFLVIPALLILLYDAPIGTLLIPGIGPIADYIFRYLAASAFRGFIAAASLGTLLTSIRTIIGREKGYLPEEA